MDSIIIVTIIIVVIRVLITITTAHIVVIIAGGVESMAENESIIFQKFRFLFTKYMYFKVFHLINFYL